jgi:hypothetical protein
LRKKVSAGLSRSFSARRAPNQKDSLDRAGIRFFDGRVVSDCVDTPVACSEKRAKNPTHRANDDGSKKGIPKAIDPKRGNDLRHEKQEEGINHKNEKPHCYDDEW